MITPANSTSNQPVPASGSSSAAQTATNAKVLLPCCYYTRVVCLHLHFTIVLYCMRIGMACIV